MMDNQRSPSQPAASQPSSQTGADILSADMPAVVPLPVIYPTLSQPQARTQTYQRWLQQWLILPLGGLLLLITLLYSAFDLYQTTKSKLHYTTTVTTLITQAALAQQPELVKSQIEYALANSPFIDNIAFYPISMPRNVQPDSNNTPFNLATIFLENELSISQPVAIADYSDPNAKQLIGYIHTTLNLKKTRLLWFTNNFPVMLLVFLSFSTMLVLVLRRIRKLTQRLPVLEQISQQLIENPHVALAEQQLTHYVTQLDHPVSAPANAPIVNQTVWVFEQALRQLLDAQRIQRAHLTKLTQEYQQLLDKTTSKLTETSNFQNTLTHEFKLDLNKIQAGISLLNNQYISQEQKDALEIIELGQRDLTAKLNQIIQLQRLEKGQVGIQLEQINPTQLLTQIVELYEPIAAQKGLSLSLQAQHTEYLLEGDRQKMVAIITALVENAVQFTEKGSVTIVSQLINLPQAIRWQVAVTDTGIGIAEKYQSRIFEPFFQVNPDNNGSLAGGNNLADMDLSLAAKVTTLLGGTLAVKSELGIGSTFTFSIKLDEWHRHFERLLLKDKVLAVFHYDRLFKQVSDKVIRAGAKVQSFNQPTLLLAALAQQPVDAVLISPEISQALLTQLVKQIRHQETQYQVMHRTLIIVYYHQILPDIDILQGVGVDYFESHDPDIQPSEQIVKRLLTLLN